MPVSCAALCHIWFTIVILCDNINIYEAYLEAFVTQFFFIGSNLLYRITRWMYYTVRFSR